MSGTVAVPAARSRQLATALPELLFFVGAFAVTAASLPRTAASSRSRGAGARSRSSSWRRSRSSCAPTVRLGRLELGFLGARHGARRLDAALERLVDRPLVVDARGTARARSDRSRRRRARARARPGPCGRCWRPSARHRRRLRLRARDPALPGAGRQLRPARRLPAQHADRLLERARRLRGDRGRARARLRGPRHAGGHARGRRGEPARARADAVLHLQPRRVARPLRGARRARRARLAPASARRHRSLRRCPWPALAVCSPRVRTH